MFKRALLTLLASLVILPSAGAFALNEAPGEEVELAEEAVIAPVVSANTNVEVNKSVIFDATGTESLEDGELSYEWFFGDGNRQQGPEVVHSYLESGEYEVTLVVRDGQGNQASVTHTIFAFEQTMALITNIESEVERVERFVESAKNEQVHIQLVSSISGQSDFLSDETLKKDLLESLSLISDVDTIIVWTKGSGGLTVLSQAVKSSGNPDLFKSKNIIFISDQEFNGLRNIARGVYKTIQPNKIILTRTEAIWATLESFEIDPFVQLLEERAIQFDVVDEKLRLKPWNAISFLVSMMIDRGVPSNTLLLVLLLPVIVTLVAFMKQVVGLSTLGVYTPSILTLSFLALDLTYGLLFLLAILVVGTLTRLFLRRYRLLYIPRMAIVHTIVSLTILFLLLFGAAFDISQIVGIAVFPMLFMSTMVEKFVSIQSGKGLKSAVILIGEAVLVAVICYFVAEWQWLRILLLGHPEVIFLFLLANIGLARWSGLRLVEYFRFREILRHIEE